MASDLHFVVYFDNPSAAYFTGQAVGGIVRLRLDRGQTFRGVTVECVGKCEVNWTEETRREVNGQTETETIVHYDSENYFYHRIVLQGNRQESKFGAGYYEYPFSFQLPHQLPTSFEGQHGNVRYFVRAKAERPWAFDYEFKAGFSVNTFVDLNQIPAAAEAVNNSGRKTVCCLCCKSGPIVAKCWIPKKGYVPGEAILFCGEVDNQSSRELVSTKLKLIEKCKFRAQGREKCTQRTIGEVVRRQSSEVESDLWDHVPILVPPVCPSGLPHCMLIDVSYVLDFIVDPGSFSFNLNLPMEIIVGTIPLQQTFGEFRPLPAADAFYPSAPSIPGPEQHLQNPGFAIPVPMPQYPNLPPVTYKPSAFQGDLKEKGDSEHLNYGFNTNFIPNYMSYESSLFPAPNHFIMPPPNTGAN